MRTQAQLDGFEASSGIFPLLCAKTLSSAPKRMHALRANAPIHCTSRAVVVRPNPMNRDDISLAPLPQTDRQLSRPDRIASAAFCYLKVWPNAGPITTVCLDALNSRHLASEAMRSSTGTGKRVALSGEATREGPMTLHMTFLRREFLLAVILATAAATSALGQTPAAGADPRATPGATSIPDFSGLWTHAALGFESPVSGPGPVRNLGRTP